jgi:thioesterase domain-containing protein
MSYKTKYKEALKAANLTEDSLLPKVKKQLSDVKALEQALIDADEDEQEDIEASLEALDDDLCKKIEKNSFYKEQAARMQAGRNAKKAVVAPTVVEPAPAKEEVKAPVEEPKKDEGNSSGLFFGVLASVAGLVLVGKWQKWF